MSSFKMKKLAVATLAAASFATVAVTADACSRITLDTPHGVSTVRTLDWGQQLGTVAVVHPVGEQRQTRAIEGSEYSNPAKWVTKYQSLSLEEHDVFGGTVGEAINVEGLSASMLYMDPSKEFVADHADSGAPALNLKDVTAFLVENYKSVDEVVKGFENGEWIQAWKDGIDGHRHGLHVSVQDKSGDVALFELNEGGKVVVHRGDVKSDLRVMANAPLQQDHRAYAKNFNMSVVETNAAIPNSISSADRMLRGLYHTENVKFDPNASWDQTEGKLQSTFDAGNLVPQDIIDHTNGETYATWIQYTYNFENGSFKMRNLDTYREIRMNLNDIRAFDKPMCADLVEQANAGEGEVAWSACSADSVAAK